MDKLGLINKHFLAKYFLTIYSSIYIITLKVIKINIHIQGGEV